MTADESETEAPGFRREYDASTVQSLLVRLGNEPDEVCVISVVGACQKSGTAADLLFGSVLFGPPQMADESWPQWSARTDRGTAAFVARWKAAGLDLSRWREFSEVRDGFLYGRWTLIGRQSAATVASWLSELLSGRITTIPVSGSPLLRATAHAATALIRAFPALPSPAAPLILAAERPVTGFLFPLELIPDLPKPDPNWTISGYPLSNAPLWILGLPICHPPLHDTAYGPEAAPVPGLFVGRLQRQAWITGLYGPPGADTFTVRLGIDETRISLADLEIVLEEYVNGDFAGARRLRLGDLALPPGQEVTLELPTLGPGLQRQVRLFDHNGLLLDATDRFFVVEQINISVTITVPGAPPPSAPPIEAKVGQAKPVALLDRLKRADQAEAAYRAMLQAGLPGRVIDDPAQGLPALTARLGQAYGHLDILDPYFGHNVADWRVLDQVRVAVRVLAGHGVVDRTTGALRRKILSPPPGTAPQAPSLNVRSWRGRSTPWHVMDDNYICRRIASPKM